MKILAICGSPHKGNCYSILSKIKEDCPTIDFKLIMLYQMNLRQCIGCYMCIAKGVEYCPLKDDREIIVKEMLDADGIVFASSVHVNHITAIMKHFIGRVGYESHRPRFFNKYAMSMAVCGGFGADIATKYMDSIFSTFGFNMAPSLELQVSTKSEKEKKHNYKKATDAFDRFITKIKKRQRDKPTLSQVVIFNMYKSIALSYKDYFKADYQYYKDKKDYYYDTKINFFHKWIANQEVKKFQKDIAENR